MKTRWMYAALALMVPVIQAHAGAGCGLACTDGTPGTIPVPEPATLGLLAAGAGALAILRARRRK